MDVDPNALVAIAIILQMLSCAVLTDMDAIQLARTGRTQPSLASRLLPPVYLWRRSVKFFVAFLCFLTAGIAVALPSVNRGYLTGFGVPACNSFFADYAMQGALDAVLETSFYRTTRKCYGEIDGRAYRYAFELTGSGLRTTISFAGK